MVAPKNDAIHRPAALTDFAPTVSIVTAVFNGVDAIADALASVQAQRHVAVEHVVIGGVSNRSARNMLQTSRGDLRAMRAHGVGGPATLAAKNLRKLPQFL